MNHCFNEDSTWYKKESGGFLPGNEWLVKEINDEYVFLRSHI